MTRQFLMCKYCNGKITANGHDRCMCEIPDLGQDYDRDAVNRAFREGLDHDLDNLGKIAEKTK